MSSILMTQVRGGSSVLTFLEINNQDTVLLVLLNMTLEFVLVQDRHNGVQVAFLYELAQKGRDSAK